MKCPRCGSENINANVINEVREKKNHGCLWWVLIGWWWRLIWFIFFGMWYLLYRAIKGSTTIVSEQKTICVCQNCGHRWEKR